MLNSSRQLTNLLLEILNQPTQRSALIKEFQAIVWSADGQDEEWELFNHLAYQFDYYEPDQAMRQEEPTYFDDEQLESEIRQALTKLGCVVVVPFDLLAKLKYLVQEYQLASQMESVTFIPALPTAIEAIFDGVNFRPTQPLTLKPYSRVRLAVEVIAA